MTQTVYLCLLLVVALIFYAVCNGYGRCYKLWQAIALRRAQRKPPPDLLDVLNGLSTDWRLISYKWHGFEWEAELGIEERRFWVMWDAGYPGRIQSIEISGASMPSPDDVRWISGNPDYIRQHLKDSVAVQEN